MLRRVAIRAGNIQTANVAVRMRVNSASVKPHRWNSARWCSEVASPEEHYKMVPVTVITGFLGAGKTTLLNHLLRNNGGKKFAVIENEIGEIGIDDMLVHKEKGDENIFELNNGCLCCTVRTDLIEILGRLSEKPGLDAVIVETTGLADPSPIIQTFMMQDRYTLDGVVTVVDSLNIKSHIEANQDSGSEIINQIAYADRILLNKIDALTEAGSPSIEEVRSLVKNINGSAEIIETSSSVVEPNAVLGVNAFDGERVKELLHQDHHHHHHHDHGHDHGHGHAPHPVKKGVSTICFHQLGDMNPAGLAMYLETLLARFGPQLYRYKGVISARGEGSKLVIQGVPNLRNGPHPLEPWLEDETRQTKLVFIGKDLDEPLLRDGFDRCIAPETLRFAVGDKVLCAAEEDTGMSEGTVEAHWDAGYPYRIRLDSLSRSGHHEVWAPFDEDMFVTKV